MNCTAKNKGIILVPDIVLAIIITANQITDIEIVTNRYRIIETIP